MPNWFLFERFKEALPAICGKRSAKKDPNSDDILHDKSYHDKWKLTVLAYPKQAPLPKKNPRTLRFLNSLGAQNFSGKPDLECPLCCAERAQTPRPPTTVTPTQHDRRHSARAMQTDTRTRTEADLRIPESQPVSRPISHPRNPPRKPPP